MLLDCARIYSILLGVKLSGVDLLQDEIAVGSSTRDIATLGGWLLSSYKVVLDVRVLHNNLKI